MTDTQDDRELSTYTHAHDGDQLAIFRNGQPVYFVRDVAAQGEKAVLLCLLGKCADRMASVNPIDSHDAEQLEDLIQAVDNVLNPENAEGLF